MTLVHSQPLLHLRPMRITDLNHVIAIEEAAYTHPWSKQIFQDCLRVGYRAWVLEENQVLLGYGLLSIAAGEAHVLNLCVHPQHQSRGHGREILKHLLTLAQQNKVETVFLEVRRSHHATIQFYQDVGFNQIGIRKDYYPDSKQHREDALVFAITLLPSSTT